MESVLDIASVFRWLRLSSDPESVAPPKPLPPFPAITVPPKPLPTLPAITYDKGLPSLPEDIIHEILGLLDMESLKSCSLTGKVISRSTKPIIHRTLYLTSRRRVNYLVPRDEPNSPGRWDEFKGLPVLGECGLLQHTRHLSIVLDRNPLFPPFLEPHVRYMQALTNLRSFKTRWLDLPSFLPKMGEYFGSFFGSLQSLDLEFPRGDHQQILYFVCQFANLRNIRIRGTQDYTHSMRNGGPHFDINTFPPLDGTLELVEFHSGRDKSAMLIINNLITAPLKFRSLKLFGCAGDHTQLLIDACAPKLEHMDLGWDTAVVSQWPRFNLERHPKFRELELRLPAYNIDRIVGWLSGTLSTVVSNEFRKLTIHIVRVSSSFPTQNGDLVRGWNSVDDVLDRLSLCEDVTLVLRPKNYAIDGHFKGLVEKYFPLMWENERVVLETCPPDF